MNETTKKYLAWLIVVVAILVAGYLGVVYPIPAPPSLPAPPVVEPQALTSGGIKCHSVGPTGACIEIWNGGDIRVYSNQGTTSKFSVDGATGDTTIAGNLGISGSTVDGGAVGNSMKITAPTAVASATPALRVNNLGAANDVLSIEKAGTPVFSVGNAGAITMQGALTANDAAGFYAGAKVVGATAAATATPAMIVNGLGATNDLLSVQKAATPVFKVGNAGVVVGQVLQYGASGQKVVCGTTTITGTGTLAHALPTPSFVQLSLAQDATGDCNYLSYTNAAAVVTAKCWNSALTPAAAAASAVVGWCVIGTP